VQQQQIKPKTHRRWGKILPGAALGLLLLPFIPGCSRRKPPSASVVTLTAARQGFKTTVQPQSAVPDAVEVAPANLFKTITYPAASGDLAAYLTPNPGDGKKHPAIIWITGGDCNSIGDVWSPMPPDNEQTAAAYRQAGIIMMFPSLRGGNHNPGTKEGFLGEVDDVLAALKFLEQQAYVDPQRIYLGGHSTGGTLALLVAESTDRFRAVFAFGPVDNVANYGADSQWLPFDVNDQPEVQLRSPGYWLTAIKSPVWVLEGTERGNIDPLRAMAQAATNPQVHFIEVKGADHFTILAPTNALIAQKILQDPGAPSHLTIAAPEVNRAFAP
jgi:dipeptidyl aminopeptidase/acylaminoacyl peptidase